MEDNAKSVEDSSSPPVLVNTTGSSVPVVEDSGLPSDEIVESGGPSNGELDNHSNSGIFCSLKLISIPFHTPRRDLGVRCMQLYLVSDTKEVVFDWPCNFTYTKSAYDQINPFNTSPL